MKKSKVFKGKNHVFFYRFPTKNQKYFIFLVSAIASAIVLILIFHSILFVPQTSDIHIFVRTREANRLVDDEIDQTRKEYVHENLPEIADVSNLSMHDFHEHVVYYNDAPWKAEIGIWLAKCYLAEEEVNVVEVLSNNNCKNDCNGHGVCNKQLGECRCYQGYAGEDCSERIHLSCNFPASAEYPFGRPGYGKSRSICAAHCDTTRAMCFCGEATKYPNRPASGSCSFHTKYGTDWKRADLDIFSANGSGHGWCNVDPSEVYNGNVRSVKRDCQCTYDCFGGRFCEIPIQCFCINQCSGHGYCNGGSCQCESGWYGIDCSIPSISSPRSEWPSWLQPAPDAKYANDSIVVTATKRRPLIYVYDLPPKFNSHLIEGRQDKTDCVHRLYDENNATQWTKQLYGAQIALYESILASPHRTLNGDEADFFYVPVLDSCLLYRADESPHLSFQDHGMLRSSLALDLHKMAYDYIVQHYPYWNRSSGKDHMWFFPWDEGACYAPKEIWNSMMLVHWGNTNSKHNNSVTGWMSDNWDVISPDRRGNHPCFDPDKDLVLPAWKLPNPTALKKRLWDRPLKKRNILFYFNGELGWGARAPEPKYSMGIRQKISQKFSYGQYPDVVVTSAPSPNYHEELASSIFCGVLPGEGWSGRMEDSVLQGCIPVVIQDGILQPYENVLNHSTFSVRISEDDIPNLVKILRSIHETEIESKQKNIKRVWQRFLYRDAMLLEASRQNKSMGYVSDWAKEISKLDGDDAFTTFIQVLQYKLHNDPWRQKIKVKKEFGTPSECLRQIH